MNLTLTFLLTTMLLLSCDCFWAASPEVRPLERPKSSLRHLASIQPLSSTITPTTPTTTTISPLITSVPPISAASAPTLPLTLLPTAPGSIPQLSIPQPSQFILPPIVPLAPSMMKTSLLLTPGSFLTKIPTLDNTTTGSTSGLVSPTSATITSTSSTTSSSSSSTGQPFLAQITHQVDNVTNQSTVHINLEGLFDDYDPNSYTFSDDPDGQLLANSDTWN